MEMLKKSLYELKSGSDFRGTAVGECANLTQWEAAAIARGFAAWLGRDGQQLTIALGRDSRISGEELLNAAAAELKNAGVRVLDCGMISTPCAFMLTQFQESAAHGAIMFTASHHPYNKNGLKLFSRAGGLDGKDLDELIELSANPLPKSGGSVTSFDGLSLYCSFLQQKIRQQLEGQLPLSGLKIAVDAGNGSGGFYASKVLEPLGADISGSQFLEPDGYFPNHAPNPEDKAAMASACNATVSCGADMGIIFDTDVDRAGIVSASGKEYNRNRLIALISAVLLRKKQGITIVADSVASNYLVQFVKSHGGTLHRFKRGYKNVINEAKRLNELGIDCPIAIETSGHAALRDNYFLDDGAFLATLLVIEFAALKRAGKNPESLIASLQEPKEEREIRYKILSPDFKAAGKQVLQDVLAAALQHGAIQEQSHDGIRLLFPTTQASVLLRPSVHDPALILNIENSVQSTLELLEPIITLHAKK